jgi:hypothetical protein
MSRCYRYADGEVRCYNSAWDNWVRWLVLALIVIAAFLLFFAFSCISARRRRKLGHSPYRGTGWAVGNTPAGHAPAQVTSCPFRNLPFETLSPPADPRATQYNNNAQPYYQNPQPYYNNSNNPPPAYTPPPNQGYYAQNNYANQPGVELQQPQPAYGAYRNAEGEYAPPKGPPPTQ